MILKRMSIFSCLILRIDYGKAMATEIVPRIAKQMPPTTESESTHMLQAALVRFARLSRA